MTNKFDSNKSWNLVDQDLLSYNERQYDEKYRSTDFVISCLSNQIGKDSKYTILDVGCGGGANLRHIAPEFQKCNFTGIDINEYFINFAKTKHNKCGIINTDFIKADFSQLGQDRYDIVGSTQFLEVLDFEKAEKFKHKCFQVAKKSVYFQALFTDRNLDFEINIHDYIYNKVVPYNIFSIKRLSEIANFYGFELKQKTQFIIDIDLPNVHEGRGTYTINTSDGERMMFSDVLHLPWYFIYFEKTK